MSLLEQTKKRRQILGLSQQELSARAGISLATVQNIESGKANPSLSTLESLGESLGLEIQLIPKFKDLEPLIAHGLPLASKKTVKITSTKAQLIALFYGLIPYLKSINSREEKALRALLWGIKDHFPSTWKIVPTPIKKYFEKKLKASQASIKLRRIAIKKLSEYL